VIRETVKKRKLFPTDDSAMKVVYLAIMDASKRWTMPIWNWKATLNRFVIDFEDRLINYV
jgi:putative transposase